MKTKKEMTVTPEQLEALVQERIRVKSMTMENYFDEVVGAYTRKQCLSFCESHDLETLQTMCQERLMQDFSDCETVEDMENIPANFKWIEDPKLENQLKGKKNAKKKTKKKAHKKG